MGYTMVQQDSRRPAKSETAFRTISEVADELDVPQHVLRFWETKFTQIRPMKRGGGRRYYRPEDVTLLRRIRALLYDDGFTIKGVQKLLRDGGAALGEMAPALGDTPGGDGVSPTVSTATPPTLASVSESSSPEASLSAEDEDDGRSTVDSAPSSEPEQIDIFMAIERQVAAEGLRDWQRQEIAAVIDDLIAVQRLLSGAETGSHG